MTSTISWAWPVMQAKMKSSGASGHRLGLSSAQQAKELGGSENERERERESERARERGREKERKRGGHAAICSVPSILGQTQFLVVTPTFAE